ncbi:peptidoglycan-binding protein [Bacillus sp. H-16]|uniref:peptidoglycan-binding protein n=1 Tax=Alteribacter salitolerans TaxID=2912333 RepID=UPI001962976A|nr:peptidoglycan-binding protein [Alteribacter salitolerans]MBM7094403.1 peptidoglycan-binding protein [Alteribacter salitolerans]
MEFTLLTGKRVAMMVLAFASFFLISIGETQAESLLGDKLLHEGKSHEQVSMLQELLSERGYIESEVQEGTYDQATRNAVMSFQKEHSLLTDGVAGPQTLGALQVLRQGDEGQVVLALQEDLAALGIYTGKLDGEFGPVTHRSVKTLQQENGILVDGLAGPQTYGKLHKALNNPGTVVSPSSSSSSNEASSSLNSSDSGTSSSANSGSASNSEGSTSSSSESSSSESSGQANAETSDASSSGTDRSGNTSASQGQTMTVEATAYTAYCNGCSGITATGLDLRSKPDKKVIAVDPSVIPLGSTVHVEGYGTFIAGDTGGAIRGNKIDIFMPSREDAIQFGRRTVTITVQN